MVRKCVNVLTFCIVAVLLPSAAAAASGPVLVGMGNVVGQLHPYDSESGVVLGGLAERIGYIRALQGEGEPVVVADAGDFLFAEPSIAALTPDESSMTGEFLAEVYGEIPVAAVNVGERDLALGIEFLQELAEMYGLPLVSANLTSLSGSPIFASHRIVEVGDARVLLTGVLSRTAGSEVSSLTGYQAVVQDPVRAVRSILQSAARATDTVVVLSQLTDAEERALAKALPAVRVIVGSSAGSGVPGTEEVNQAVIVRPQERGGSLALYEFPTGQAEIVSLAPGRAAADPGMAERIEEFEVELHEKCGC